MNGLRTLVLSGGVGGAKLCLGLQRMLPAGSLSIVVNTGDDFEHLGLSISPDLDTTLYTLAGLANPETGWGRRNETWTFMDRLATLGGQTWFRIGDGDLALHVERTRRLATGETLSAITADIAGRLGVRAHVLPMSDAPVRTLVNTRDGEIAFQEYFVRRQCAPAVNGLRFMGAAAARPTAALERALRAAHGPHAIVIAPSNPYLSIDPILSVPGIQGLLRSCGVPVVAVTPLIGGAAVKGPTAKIMKELGIEPSPLAVARHYRGLIDGFVLDEQDAHLAARCDVPVHVCDTLMTTLDDRERVARSVLEFAVTLAEPGVRTP